jgi:DNA-binding winged helix-turn-helix (wHTH) protein
MVEQHKDLYEFDPFLLDVGERLLLRDGEAVPLAPKAFDMLVVLVQNGGRLLSKDDLMSAIWGDITVEEANLPLYISSIRKALGDSVDKPRYVRTVHRQGYRFIAPVLVRKLEETEPLESTRPTAVTDAPQVKQTTNDGQEADAARLPESLTVPRRSPRGAESAARLAAPFGGHLWHVLVSSALYALLYVIALLLEVAYQFDRLGSPALRLTPWVFFWVFGAAAVGLWVDWRWTFRGKTAGLLLSLPAFIFGGLLLYMMLGQFLPRHPVTEADFQTYPAHGAFLKSVYYFLPLAVVFMVLPYHFVLSIQRELREGKHRPVLDLLAGKRSSAAPAGAVYLRVWWLAVVLVAAASAALVAMAHMFESLKPNPHSGLFVQLAQWRFLLYVILGLECVVWYYWVLNGIKRECLEALSAGKSSAADRET